MKKSSLAGTLLRVLALAVLVVGLSALIAPLWGDKPETLPEPAPLALEPGMTVEGFGAANGLQPQQLKEIFGLGSRADLDRPITDFALPRAEMEARVGQARALGAQYASKNWLKIPLKFGLWFAFLGLVFVLVRRQRVGAGMRKGLYLAAVLVFGAALGSDPSPMGTVKDTIHLLAAEGVVFPPRLAALGVFLALVVVFNKSICGWGCQLGALQDLIFRLGRDPADRGPGAVPQFRPPFALTNAVRAGFLVLFTAVAVGLGLDIIEPVDPFRIYKPASLGLMGGGFVVLVLAASLFIYRPWCTLLCPFGLAGWVFEKLSVFRIKVDYDKCIACQACARACPSRVMEAILRREKMVIPDCFACGTCIQVCPTQAVSLAFGRRALPPAGHFDKAQAEPGE